MQVQKKDPTAPDYMQQQARFHSLAPVQPKHETKAEG